MRVPRISIIVAMARNGVIGADDVMDATSLPKVKMPNRTGFSSAIKAKR
jgi:hypothetical protein